MNSHRHLLEIIVEFNQLFVDFEAALSRFSESRSDENFEALVQLSSRLETSILRLNYWNLSVLGDVFF